MNTEPKTKPCAKCGVNFTFEPNEFNEFFDPRHCEPCAVEATAEYEAQRKQIEQAEKEKEIAQRWLAICPVRFQDTDESRIPQKSRDAIAEWLSSDATNLAFIGAAGTCKTRAGFLALKAASDAGESCEYVSHSAIAEIARDASFGDDTERARNKMRWLKKCAVLFVDDIGKPPATERADADFEALIDHRYAHKLATIWTSNAGGTWLASRVVADRGEPIVRRLAEDAIIVKL